VVRIVDRGVVWHARVIAPEDGRPARKIVTGRRRRVTGFVPSRKAGSGGLIPWESELERDYVVVAELCPEVKSIIAQPHTLEVWSDAGSFQHTPDYLVGSGRDSDPGKVIEVKPDKRSLEPETERRLRISAEAHRALGFTFSVAGESVIRARPRLTNVQTLLRYRLAATRDGLPHRVATLLASAVDGMSVDECVRALDGRPSTRFELYALSCRGLLDLDLSVPLGPDTALLGCRLLKE
jgi:hypothetical protein